MGKMFQWGSCIPSSILKRWDAKKIAIYRVIRLVDVGVVVAQEEGQGKPRELSKAQEKKGDILRSWPERALT